MPEVLFIYKYLPQYRVEFFQKLREELLIYNINLHLIYGKSKGDHILRKDEVEIAWATFIPNKAFKIGGVELIWQPCLKHLKGKDMIIVQPELKLIVNYYLMLCKRFRKYKLGFWGHGRNMQGRADSFRNKFNDLFLSKCDWWFAYTKGVKEYLVARHYSKNNISIVQNAIDTIGLRKDYNKISHTEIDKIKNNLGITGDNTAIYCGAMYHEKRIDFILQAAHKIKDKIPDFNLILIGSGIEADKVKKAAEENTWIHYPGPKFGSERVVYFKISALQLMPGAVGLGILDSFALETPIVTTEYPFHGPEIDYLENWKNGVITKNDLQVYADTVVNVLMTDKYLQLTEGCRNASELYTMQSMVENFREGILSCIGSQTEPGNP